MSHLKTIELICQQLELSADAGDWVMGMWQAIQFFDDIEDGEFEKARELNLQVLNFLLVDSPTNHFYFQNSLAISSCVAIQLAKWLAANDAENENARDEKSFMWRAGFYDLLLLVVMIDRGRTFANENARAILALYGEALPDYLEGR